MDLQSKSKYSKKKTRCKKTSNSVTKVSNNGVKSGTNKKCVSDVCIDASHGRETNNSNDCKNRKSGNHLITDYFPTLSFPGKRLTAKVLALQSEKIIRHYVSNKCDPTDYLSIIDIENKGRGVVAKTLISKSSFICEYSGDLVTMKEAKMRELEYETCGAGCYMYYFNWANNNWCVDATKPTQRFGRLINHSRKSPNCKTRLFIHNGSPHLIFVAIRDIEPNEEILYDYGERNKFAIEGNPWLNST